MTEVATFLEQHNLSQEDWSAADVTWDALKEIECNFDRRKNEFEQSALSIAAVLQKNKSVHSVRWRIKDSGHLLAKIVRKRSKGSQKYADINASNYDEIITDLVGVRVLHLFKEEWKDIQDYIDESWGVVEGPTVYYREGDKLEQFSDCDKEKHKDGYRSIHSIITTRLQKKEVQAEVQVRTVFEEAWSEIDHQVRYPNYSDNETLTYFLNIFNGLAGYADEMGTFVKKLAYEITASEESTKVHEQLLTELKKAEIEKTEQMKELESLAKTNKKLQSALNKLKDTEDKIQKINVIDREAAFARATNPSPSFMDAAIRANEKISSPSFMDAVVRAKQKRLDNYFIF
ncbi:RelA/SpoT domain-containing protein [Vibrio parahaemolyticus]|uniref:RelA/SpoT domain-containing protein n=1 Tax=Vibrio parahaemolyticus TaxID=670 RepID=UPI00178D051A|nr:RelA/SpoT domain-containing protein [Vibrio parahaemolyticus]